MGDYFFKMGNGGDMMKKVKKPWVSWFPSTLSWEEGTARTAIQVHAGQPNGNWLGEKWLPISIQS